MVSRLVSWVEYLRALERDNERFERVQIFVKNNDKVVGKYKLKLHVCIYLYHAREPDKLIAICEPIV
jgi:hypothetical protein